ncbi:Zinc finger protein [Temnothorax longispinosus]|uniref:Zinc finger protein n=1 Tax=Temnothorax longispinosus TaxID=300112 RepID=A0A4S2KLV2_9HYME|nr:Zinc finger protein [Temnothorax longispinosus]
MKCAKFSCPNPNCRSVFELKIKLHRHLRHCDMKPKFMCPYCDYMSKFKADTQRHIRAKHKKWCVYVIDIERNTVYNKGPITYPRKRFKKLAKFPCPNSNCRSAFGYKANLQKHLRYCCQKPRFKCPYCHYGSKRKTDIKRHIHSKHKNRYVYIIDIVRNVIC